MKRFLIIGAVAVGMLLVWGAFLAYRAHRKLVTLTVRDMEVREVVKRIEWQTWERIIVHNQVVGRVTLNVRKVPLAEVLNIVTLQTSSRWTALYPIYSAGGSVVTLRKLVRGDLAGADRGWTNLFTAPGWRRGTRGGFANNARAANNLVSAQFENKDLGFAALALSRFSQAQVVAEDGADSLIDLRLEQVPFESAVTQVAKKAHRQWDRFYTLQPLWNVVIRPTPVVAGGGAFPPAIAGVAAWMPPQLATGLGLATATSAVTQAELDQAAAARAEAREREFEAQLATMTPAERAQAVEQRNAREELRQLPPQEQQQRLQEMAAKADPQQLDLQQRMLNRLKNLTPDQRVQRDRARLERQKSAQP